MRWWGLIVGMVGVGLALVASARHRHEWIWRRGATGEMGLACWRCGVWRALWRTGGQRR